MKATERQQTVQEVTNSSIQTFLHCRYAYFWRYVECLVPAKPAKNLNYGQLFHELMLEMYTRKEASDFKKLCRRWVNEKIHNARKYAEEQQEIWGFYDQEFVDKVEKEAVETAKECYYLACWYRDYQWKKSVSKFQVLFAEQNFNVPVLTSADQRHPVIRYRGKWDLITQNKNSGAVWIIDHKTTSRRPTDFGTMCQLDTQPVGYYWAASYLASPVEKTTEDEPTWPVDSDRPEGFITNIIRKKVPQKPRVTKDGKRFYKNDMDTTPELLIAAIRENGFDEKDYQDVLQKLQDRGPAFVHREIINTDSDEIKRWHAEVLLVSREMRKVERGQRLFRGSSWGCQNFYGRKCSYHPLCYGDKEQAIKRFSKLPPHSELL